MSSSSSSPSATAAAASPSIPRRLLWNFVCTGLPVVEHESARAVLGERLVQANEELCNECFALVEILQDIAPPVSSATARSIEQEAGRVWLEEELRALVSQLESACAVFASQQSSDGKSLESIYRDVTEGESARAVLPYLQGPGEVEEEHDEEQSQKSIKGRAERIAAIEAFVREWAKYPPGLGAAGLDSSPEAGSARTALNREGDELRAEVDKLHRLIEAGCSRLETEMVPPTMQTLRGFRADIISGIEKAMLLRQLACPENGVRQYKATGYVKRYVPAVKSAALRKTLGLCACIPGRA